MVELEALCQDLMQEVELVSDRQQVLAGTQEVSREGIRGIQGVREAKGQKKSWNSCKRSKNAAQIGRIEGGKALEWRSRQQVH